jgi:DNA-directed RNA polymerase subunit RPC12/RpoP
MTFAVNGLLRRVQCFVGWHELTAGALQRCLHCGWTTSTEWTGTPSSGLAELVCPRCGETRLVERIGRECYCSVCGQTFKV